jgi:hypothetical protein
MPVVPINMVVGKKRIIRKKWMAEEEEERHKGSQNQPKKTIDRVDAVYNHTFPRFSQIFGETNCRFSFKNQCYDPIFTKSSRI